MADISFSDNTRPCMKDLYERYYSERDKQITNFWEHSKYVWGFIALCFTGYGIILKEFLEKLETIKLQIVDNYSFALIGIALLGLIASIILLWMMKACKAWYEVFEMAIWQIESEDNYFKFHSEYLIKNFISLKNPNKKNRKFDSEALSPTKINIAIAYILIFLWATLLIVHLASFLTNYNMPNREYLSIIILCFVITVIMVLVCCITSVH